MRTLAIGVFDIDVIELRFFSEINNGAFFLLALLAEELLLRVEAASNAEQLTMELGSRQMW